MYTDVSGIILSGGKSSRMGTDKALLKSGDVTIIQRLTKLMQSVFKEVFIITNTPEDYSFLNVPVYEDIIKHKGPLSGIHSGLVHSSKEKNFFISCDMPLISAEFINYLIEYNSDKPAVYCIASGKRQYLAGVYKKRLLPEIENILTAGPTNSKKKENQFSIKNLLKNTEAEIIIAEKLPFFSENLFFNLNTPNDFEKLKQILLSQ